MGARALILIFFALHKAFGLDLINAMRYIPTVLKSLSKIVALSTIALSPLAIAKKPSKRPKHSLRTKSHRPGHIVSDNPTMKAWLKKMPEAFKDIKAQHKRVVLTDLDVKWKQTNTTRTLARARGKSTTKSTHVCELYLTIKFADSHSNEAAPSRTHQARPVRVNSRCDTFMAKNSLIPVDDRS